MPAPRGDPKHSKEDRRSIHPIVVTLTTGKSCLCRACCHSPAQIVDTIGLTLAPQNEGPYAGKSSLTLAKFPQSGPTETCRDLQRHVPLAWISSYRARSFGSVKTETSLVWSPR